MQKQSDRETFYQLLNILENKTGGRRKLGDCHGRMLWPERGVYFFFEPEECRATPPYSSRIVRVGTHALKTGSRTTIWKRLRQHRGTLNPYGGNHRGSIFRLLIGQALMQRDPLLESHTWGQEQNASKDIKQHEIPLEQKVSAFIGKMKLIFLPIADPPGPDSLRGFIERNSIALLSGYSEGTDDQPSKFWLGLHSSRAKVKKSGLWNNNHVDENYDPSFLIAMESLIVKVSA